MCFILFVYLIDEIVRKYNSFYHLLKGQKDYKGLSYVKIYCIPVYRLF